MSSPAGKDECGEKEIQTDEPDVLSSGDIPDDDQRNAEIGGPNQQVAYDVEPAMEVRPFAAMPSWRPIGTVQELLKEIYDIPAHDRTLLGGDRVNKGTKR